MSYSNIDKVIDYPEYLDSNTVESFNIRKVVLTDSATVLYMDAFNRPGYWVSLHSLTYLKGNDTDKQYRLIRSEGFELDKQVFMPENGNIPFVLFFEPLDEKEKTFDFVEFPGENKAYIAGVLLSEPKKKIKTILKGTVIDRPNSSCLMLAPYRTDHRINPWKAIAIHDGKFEYVLYSDVEDMFELIFYDEYWGGMMYPISFIAENGVIEFTLYPMDENNFVKSEVQTLLPLNNELTRITILVDSLFDLAKLSAESRYLSETDNYHSETAKLLLDRAYSEKDRVRQNGLFEDYYKMQKNREAYTPDAWITLQKFRQTFSDRLDWKLNYVRNNPTLSGLFQLYDLFQNSNYSIDKADISPYIAVFKEVYKSKYSDHPITEKIQLFVDGNSIQEGGRYIDFTAPDIDGKLFTLSEQINGKVALIDLWASWCGSCRRKAISMIPVYEEFKDKGFTVVGVARESDPKHMLKAVKKDGYPWLNLLELKDQNGLWQKYGVGNGGGNTFLVDASGVILAIGPDAEEVRKILSELLD